MGICSSAPINNTYVDNTDKTEEKELHKVGDVITDNYKTLTILYEALQKNGLEKYSTDIVLGIDYTASNIENGINNTNLHDIVPNKQNQYQEIIINLKRLFVEYSTGNILCYGFGCNYTKDTKVFSFKNMELPVGIDNIINMYENVTYLINKNSSTNYLKTNQMNIVQFENNINQNNPNDYDLHKTRHMSGQTSFAPIIYKTIEKVKISKKYTILIIICDGAVSGIHLKNTIKALDDASNYPISVIIYGVGMGPWDAMEKLDDSLGGRKWDNCQFVSINEIYETMKKNKYEISFEDVVLIHGFQEIPDQLKCIDKLKLQY